MSRAEQIVIGEAPSGWQDVVAVARHGAQLRLSDAAWARIDNAQAIVQQIVVSGERAYGVNTGLGALCNVSLQGEQLSRLSRNTLLSHACGVGAPLADEQTRAIICAAILNYSQGKSGIHRQVVEALLALLNRGITPQVPSQGSVGYLTHMAHVGIALLGVGQVSYRGHIVAAEQALKEEGLGPVTLGAKDGLCLVNGTPCMTGLRLPGHRRCRASEPMGRRDRRHDFLKPCAANSMRSMKSILALKPHPGMQQVGKNLRSVLAGSEVLASSQGIRTQDALSIRSIPQVHGATRDQLVHAIRQIETELNSVTDNPMLLGTPDAWRVVSQANPHGQSVAMAADVLCMAMAELGSIAERRLDRLINPMVS
ncbi:histidine ammonia-lyase, partial [Pseudomonas syringae pv. actinidiae]|nr:histidine ammonia-lyase [Pseudomonas syringae pv. actinidiae]